MCYSIIFPTKDSLKHRFFMKKTTFFWFTYSTTPLRWPCEHKKSWSILGFPKIRCQFRSQQRKSRQSYDFVHTLQISETTGYSSHAVPLICPHDMPFLHGARPRAATGLFRTQCEPAVTVLESRRDYLSITHHKSNGLDIMTKS